MHRVGNLFSRWANYESLLNAFYEVKKGKSYHDSLLNYERNLAVNLTELLDRILAGTYRPRPFREFTIHDPKTRIIQAPYLEDRIVQHAIMAVIKEPIQRRFIHQTFACIEGRGTHKASELLQRYIQELHGNGYYLKLDISKFFYSIDHSVLMRKINRIIKCKHTLKYIELFITQGGGPVGIPIGSVLSQTFANLMLNDLDQYIKRVLKCKRMVRYMDDIIILSRKVDHLKMCMDRIRQRVKNDKLVLNPNSTINRIKHGIEFVGYRTWQRYKLIRKSTLCKAVRRIRHKPDIERIFSYLAHAKQTKSLIYLIKKILIGNPQLRPLIAGWYANNQ